VCAKLGDGAAAVAAIQRALAVQPGYAPAHWRRGTYLYDQGDFDQALAAYQEAARLDPSFIGAWTGIARILLQRGEAPKAVELLERLRGESPEHAHVLSLLQAAYVQAGRPEDAAAVPTVWMASASPGQDPWQGDFRPYRARPLIERARERLERGRAQEALELLEPFVTAGSEDWNAHAYLARAHGVLGHASQARAIVDKALARDPDNVLLLNELALLLESTGERGAALATFERILALDPHHPEAARARARLAGAGG
jgi:tetratricopeptide (TPR) repeat protein